MSLSAASTNLHISTQIYLTSPRTGSRICRKERRNSQSAVSAPVSIAVFLRLLFERTDAFLRREGGSHTTPARGKLPAGLTPVSTLPTPSVRRVETSRRDFNLKSGDVTVTHGAPSTPGNPAARQISLAFGLIADTLEWPNEDYQAFIARLGGVAVSPLAITLGDVLMAYTAQCDARRDARGTDGKGAH
ncbi:MULTISPECIES: hypothetical protein [Stenotrophomonas maltophilia group]|uniref:hypothetical protein n=1 Tax=Stenotrophomonas maltophilia group TaxID=995085 RepID=UPI002155BA8F|nr:MULTISPECIES: hypothetical protein [Stenotrophomonas maltophilia group]